VSASGASLASGPGASLDLDFDDGQQALADAIARLCRDHCDDDAVRAAAGAFPETLWRELAALGVLEIGAPEGEGGALELAAAMESLGRAVFPGPLVATAFAVRVLPEAERRRVAAGEGVACVAEPPELPFAPVASVFVEVDAAEGRAWLAEPDGATRAVETLGGEPWARGALARGVELSGAGGALAAADVARAAYLAAAGRRLVDDAAEHARTRRQFGRAIGDFQAVAHPLAGSVVALEGARVLARSAAFRLDRLDAGDEAAAAWAAVARRSATRAAVDAIHVAHQAFGAVGITLEGPAFHVSRRIRQIASSPPSAAGARARVLAGFVPNLASEAHP
jgi:alkylation response protein AidB-like acyl-CoA dehydrogenase